MTTPTSPGGEPVERRWRQALAPGPDCLSIERLAGAWTDAEAAHVDGCVRCQTERDLLAAFERDEALDGEGLSVAWVAAQAKRRVAEAIDGAAAPAVPTVPPRRLPAWALMAASLALVAGGAALLYEPGRDAVGPAGPGEVYRGGVVEITSAMGDVAAAPARIEWTGVPAAAEYEVRLNEVDGTELWRLTTPTPAVEVPSLTQAAFLPGKTLVWHVDAKDATGRIVASSGEARMRVRVAGPPASEG
ncbi:MAG: hypothetical protein AB7O28_04635 [Vicinamibacterales bacterium]